MSGTAWPCWASTIAAKPEPRELPKDATEELKKCLDDPSFMGEVMAGLARWEKLEDIPNEFIQYLCRDNLSVKDYIERLMRSVYRHMIQVYAEMNACRFLDTYLDDFKNLQETMLETRKRYHALTGRCIIADLREKGMMA